MAVNGHWPFVDKNTALKVFPINCPEIEPFAVFALDENVALPRMSFSLYCFRVLVTNDCVDTPFAVAVETPDHEPDKSIESSPPPQATNAPADTTLTINFLIIIFSCIKKLITSFQ